MLALHKMRFRVHMTKLPTETTAPPWSARLVGFRESTSSRLVAEDAVEYFCWHGYHDDSSSYLIDTWLPRTTRRMGCNNHCSCVRALLCLMTTLAFVFSWLGFAQPNFFLAGLNPPPVRELEKPKDYAGIV